MIPYDEEKSGPDVRFQSPDLALLVKEGFLPMDMHIHTHHSDGYITVREIRNIRKQSGLTVAITDHNTISGVREAWKEGRRWCGVLPGIEISASDGPHILVYFERFTDLEEWFSRSVRDTIRDCPFMAVTLSSQEILDSAGDSNALVIAAHPYGYSILPRGLLKCVENGSLPAEISMKVAGIEVISGVLPRRLNERAVRYARLHHRIMTGGSDAHMTRDLGNVVTCAAAESPGEFLEKLRRRKNLVVGKESGAAGHLLSGSAVLMRYLPYIRPGLRVHMEQNLPSMGQFMPGRGKR